MLITFWTLLSLILYCYFAYPALLWVIAKIWEKPVKKGAAQPSVAMVLSVWNEEDVIERKINDLLSLDYPRDKIGFWIGSDGSTDRTNAVLLNIRDPRVHAVINGRRQGKMATINTLVKSTPPQSEIIVFTDARQVFAPGAVKELAANFADPNVGCVSGELIFQPRKEEGATAKGVSLYWNYEKFIRSHESRIHSMLGATGAIYAVRRELFEPIPENVILDDMYVPFKIIQKGFRAVLDCAARAYDQAADSPREEHRRKARTLAGNYQIFGLFPSMFNPFTSPVAVQLFSHKLLRVLAPFFMIAVFVINWMILGGGARPYAVTYNVLLAAQIIFYLMAVTGALSRHRKYGMVKLIARLCYVPYVFCLLNFSALAGFLNFITSRQEVGWRKARHS